MPATFRHTSNRPASYLSCPLRQSPLIQRSHRKHLIENCDQKERTKLYNLNNSPTRISKNMQIAINERQLSRGGSLKCSMMWLALGLLLCAGSTVARPNSTSSLQHQPHAVGFLVYHYMDLFKTICGCSSQALFLFQTKEHPGRYVRKTQRCWSTRMPIRSKQPPMNHIYLPPIRVPLRMTIPFTRPPILELVTLPIRSCKWNSIECKHRWLSESGFFRPVSQKLVSVFRFVVWKMKA